MIKQIHKKLADLKSDSSFEEKYHRVDRGSYTESMESGQHKRFLRAALADLNERLAS